MNKKWLVFIIGATLLIFLLPVYRVVQEYAFTSQPEASRGWLDLSSWNFDEDGVVKLDGEWEFYRNQLLTPEDFAAAATPEDDSPQLTGIFTLPGKWNKYISPDGRPSAEGYATFRLKVKVAGEESKLYGIHTENIRTANRIFMNGQEVGASGVTGRSTSEERPNNIPYAGFAAVSGDEIQILVQVSNHIYSSGGVFTPILFGDQHALMSERDRALLSDWITLAGFLIPALFFAGLYWLRRESSLLYLALFCIAAMMHVLTHGEKVLSMFLPDLPYAWFLKMQMFISAFIYFFLLHYVAAVIPNAVHKIAMRLCNGITVLTVATAIILPPVLFSRLEPAILLFSITGIVYTSYVLFRSIMERHEDMVFFLVGVMSLLLTIAAYLFSLFGYESLAFVPSLMLMFVITQALLIARRFDRSFAEVESLSRKLLIVDGLKDEFMANTSRELRTPLHGMINIAQSLLEGTSGKVNPEQANDLSMIVTAGKRLSVQINDILDFVKLKHEDIALRREPVDLKAVTRSVMEVIFLLSGSKNIVFEHNWPDNLPWLDTDEDRLHQILYNLLGNAVKFTDQGIIRVSASAANGQVTISVEDTGIGIAKERLDDIFKSFDETAAGHEDRGLGLGISKKLVELGGGTIWAESELGRGSVFYFTLPSIPAARPPVQSVPDRISEVIAAEQSEFHEGEPKGEQFIILTVDDDPMNQKVLHHLLSIENYSLIEAYNGTEALEQLRNGRRVDLVIADWMMPGMTGVELCREIRSRYSLFELPVLLLTSRSLPEDVQIGFQAGVNDFLRKPVDANELRARVRTLLELRKSVQTAISSEMAFLQAQIKPHFLFNALNTVLSFLPSDPDAASRLLFELSRYLRGSFDFQNRDQLVTLEKEMTLVQSYLRLEQARFQERLEVRLELTADMTLLIPPLSIQPIVENAVRHGIMQKQGGGLVHLSIREEGDLICVTVRDNGVGIPPDVIDSLLSGTSGHGGVGLRNIHTRLLTLYGEGLTIESREEMGTQVRFGVKKMKESYRRSAGDGE
ncbi:histidine kinase/DNA gyrase B/HSP90-like ATPase [Fontibacillus phaseoli]|uniref:histidine kinase n=1 Tax=Fontibacillus phaseoli TaxID=1416533 RepID=A0A369BGL6_9BACL|nr:ATP-binding protein [Fontibacillus phaseoli]RCX20683.1 histidine kinase/DNA gyrase B/HSP90-like ATPase [Fontibacillus phaseoli]